MAEQAGVDTMPTPQPQPRQGLSGWILFFVLLLVVLIVFLALPLEKCPLPWVATLQIMLRASGPYGVVALLGGIVGLAEISSTFPNYPREALRTWWARLLIVVNILAAILAFWIARVFAPEANQALLIVGVGIGGR